MTCLSITLLSSYCAVQKRRRKKKKKDKTCQCIDGHCWSISVKQLVLLSVHLEMFNFKL